MPKVFEKMAAMEEKLTKLKKKPVTVLKDKKGLIFLRKNSEHPNLRCIDDVKGHQVQSFVPECNGFCQTDFLESV